MRIQEIDREECSRILGQGRLGRLACANENQPYIVPVYLAYHSLAGEECLYGFTTPGQKIEWMRDNPLVCVEMDEITDASHWTSIIVFGRFEELHESAGIDDSRLPSRTELSDESHDITARGSERLFAYELLRKHAVWWEPVAAIRAQSELAASFIPIYYKIRIDQVSGYRATPG